MDQARSAVLAILAKGDRTGRAIRQLLEDRDIKLSGPAFYQFMANMEDEGLVTGWYEEKIVEGETIRQRWYRH